MTRQRLLMAAALALLGLAASPSPARTQQPIVLMAVGDMIFARYVPYTRELRQVVGSDAFEFVAPMLRSADLTFGNLETPIAPEPPNRRRFRPCTFRAEPQAAGWLANAGFDVLSLANNHAFNADYSGVVATGTRLSSVGVAMVGAGATEDAAVALRMFRVRGVRVAFLAFTAWTNGRPNATEDGAVAYAPTGRVGRVVADYVRAARREADFVVVSLHWGQEYARHPRERQRRQAHRIIDAGADLILGHHPHVLQDVERYRQGVIAYSLGNFIFSSTQLRQRRSTILRATLTGRGDHRRIEVQLVPILIGLDFRPRPVD